MAGQIQINVTSVTTVSATFVLSCDQGMTSSLDYQIASQQDQKSAIIACGGNVTLTDLSSGTEYTVFRILSNHQLDEKLCKVTDFRTDKGKRLQILCHDLIPNIIII